VDSVQAEGVPVMSAVEGLKERPGGSVPVKVHEMEAGTMGSMADVRAEAKEGEV